MEPILLRADRAGERADQLLARLVPELTRSAAQRLLEEGAVTVVLSAPNGALPALLDMVDTRQVMHITYGFLLQAKDDQGKPLFRDDIYRTLRANKTLLDRVIRRHIRRHLTLLGVTDKQ